MQFFNTTTGLWALRQLLQFGGAWLTFMGYADADQVGQANAALEQVIQLAGPLSFLIGFAANIFSTFRAKIVTNGQAVPIPSLPVVKQTMVKEVAVTAIEKKPTLWERLTGK